MDPRLLQRRGQPSATPRRQKQSKCGHPLAILQLRAPPCTLRCNHAPCPSHLRVWRLSTARARPVHAAVHCNKLLRSKLSRLTIWDFTVYSSQERPQQQPYTCARCRPKPRRLCHTVMRSARPYSRCTLHAPPCDGIPGVPQDCDAHVPAATRRDCDPSGMRVTALTMIPTTMNSPP